MKKIDNRYQFAYLKTILKFVGCNNSFRLKYLLYCLHSAFYFFLFVSRRAIEKRLQRILC